MNRKNKKALDRFFDHTIPSLILIMMASLNAVFTFFMSAAYYVGDMQSNFILVMLVVSVMNIMYFSIFAYKCSEVK